ncbi:MAG TPA: CusA/CzcA family heavy metal efflux RND transporter [Thermoanaerobaculia bacterium]|nr:CusA/CzcA family heavy metal efflux RND transporter [Thermoanaerobaculia bacterium]
MGLIERVVAASLRQKVFVLLCLAALVGGGLWARRSIGVEAFPDLTNNQVIVVTEAPGLGAVEVEQRVTYPVETALTGAPGATEVRSLSKFGLSMVTVVFEDSVPVYFARQLVTERLAEARGRIPQGLEPSLGPVATAFGEIYQYLVEGDGADLMEKKTLQDWEIRPRLRSVPGVSELNSWGGLTRQFHVVVDPRKLEKYGLSLRQLFDAVAENNVSFSGGFIEHRSERFTVRGVGLVRGVEDLRRLVVASVEGVPVFVGDVAQVSVGAMPRHGAVTRDGRGESVAGMVIMLKGENGKTVAGRVKARVKEIVSSLPKGLSIVPFYDQTEVIDRTSHTVQKNLLEGSLLVVLVLFFFLRDLRAALLVAFVIPVAMLAAFLGMKVFGVSANLMSLGAIDFGLIVDGAVVMVENIIRRREERGDPVGPGRESPTSFFTSAATEVARPILFGVLIIIAVYIPIFALEGLEGKMFRPMAVTVCSALVGALAVSLTAVPVLASLVLPVHAAEQPEEWFRRLRRTYVAHLDAAMGRRRRTLTVALVVVAAAIASVPFLGTEFMPRLDEGSILIETRKLPSVSLPESAAISGRVEQILMRFPEVRQVVTKIGRPDVATEAMGIYQGDVYVVLHPREAWKTGRTKEHLVDAMARALAEMPGLSANFTQPMAMRLDEVVSGVKADVAVKIFGPDAAVLEALGEDVRKALEPIRGAADLQVEALTGAAQIQVDVDREAMARYGLNVSDLRQVVETAVGGAVATEILDGPRRFGVLVRFPDALRADRAALEALLLSAPGGEKVPLGTVARVAAVRGPEAINHESGQRRLVVQTNVRGRDMGSFVAEGKVRIAAAVKAPPGYHFEWGGQFENQERAMKRLVVVIPLSLVIIFLLLFITFGMVRQALLVLVNVPFALVGGIGALWLRGLNLSLSAAVGFIALFGVAVLNGVVLVTAINHRREAGASLRAAIVGAAGTRLKPVLMTALVAALGFIPMALSSGAGSEVQRPLASVVIGGVVTSMLLTLIVLPTLYDIVEERVARRRQEEFYADAAEDEIPT